MIILAVILLIIGFAKIANIGFLAKSAIIWMIGIIAVVAGAILALPGHEVDGYRHHY